ncbi:MAG: enoyl-CoA hydratase-related protein [Chryseolinea sp.]
MEYAFIEFSVNKGVALLTLNRPEVYNALNDEITFELQAALKIVNQDENIRVAVLTGKGKAFCSGQDLKSVAGKKDFSYKKAIETRYNPIVRAIRNSAKPFICKLNGVAAGAGASLALCCDMIVAAEDAMLIQAFINIGLVPDGGSTYLLPRLIGAAKAFELAAMGTKLSANEAFDLGMINNVVPVEKLDEATAAYVEYFVNAPTKTIGLIKKMLQKSITSSLNEMLEYEALSQEIAGHTADHIEGVKAFLEKRKPSFKGK